MRINLAHIRERSTTGGWINFAVFEAKSNSGSDSANRELLNQLTARASRSGLKVEKAALAYQESGRVKFFGTPDVVAYLSRRGVPRWTHHIDV